MVCWYFVKKAVHLKKSLWLSFVRRDHCNHAERSAGAGMPPEPRSGSACKCDDLLLNINTTAPVCWHHDFYCDNIMKEMLNLCVFYRWTRSTNDLLGLTPTLTPAQIPMRWILSKPSSTLLMRNYCKNHRNPSAVYWQWILFLKGFHISSQPANSATVAPDPSELPHPTSEHSCNNHNCSYNDCSNYCHYSSSSNNLS